MLGILIKETLQCGKEELQILTVFSAFSSKLIESEGWTEIIESEICVLCQINNNVQARGGCG